MPKFRKKPVIVEATQFFYDGAFPIPGVWYPTVDPDDGGTYIGDAYVITIHGQRAYLQNGDWVITEPDGEHHYPCKPDIFEATYEAVEPEYKKRWVTLRELPPGMVFITRDGTLAVKSEYMLPHGPCRCVLLGSGEYAYFESGNDTLVCALEIKEPSAEELSQL